MNEQQDSELKDTGPGGRVVPSHSTSTDSSSWDRTAQFKKMRSPATPGYFNEIFAFQLPNTKGTYKTHYSFIHHFVGANGAPGAASTTAMANSMAVLNGGRQGTVLRGAARAGVHRHIAAHYKEAGREVPELKSDDDVDSIMMFKGLINAPLSESAELEAKGLVDLDNIIEVDSHVSWFEDGQEMKGVVIQADDDLAVVEEIDDDFQPVGEIYELSYAEIKLRTFVVMEKADEVLEKGAIVSWDTSKGKYYGDVAEVVTEGTARGEPQGLELEASEDSPVYVVRVWMSSDMDTEKPYDYDGSEEDDTPKGEHDGYSWHVTNSTVVARGDNLAVEEALPTQSQDSDYHDEDEDEETDMKNIDTEFRSKLVELIKANTEILASLADSDSEEKSAPTEDEPVAEVEILEEVKVESDAVATEEVVVEEAKADEPVLGETLEEETVLVAAEEEQPVVEAKESISFDELKEFHNLLKEMNK